MKKLGIGELRQQQKKRISHRILDPCYMLTRVPSLIGIRHSGSHLQSQSPRQ
jgi:hypothetical protein